MKKLLLPMSLLIILFTTSVFAEPAFEMKCGSVGIQEVPVSLHSSFRTANEQLVTVLSSTEKNGKYNIVYLSQSCSYVPNKEMIDILRGVKK